MDPSCLPNSASYTFSGGNIGGMASFESVHPPLTGGGVNKKRAHEVAQAFLDSGGDLKQWKALRVGKGDIEKLGETHSLKNRDIKWLHASPERFAAVERAIGKQKPSPRRTAGRKRSTAGRKRSAVRRKRSTVRRKRSAAGRKRSTRRTAGRKRSIAGRKRSTAGRKRSTRRIAGRKRSTRRTTRKMLTGGANWPKSGTEAAKFLERLERLQKLVRRRAQENAFSISNKDKGDAADELEAALSMQGRDGDYGSREGAAEAAPEPEPEPEPEPKKKKKKRLGLF